MKVPLIAITTDFTSEELPNNATSAYAFAVAEAGGMPKLLPRDIPADQYASLREKFDGVLLSGGGDVDISHFFGEPNPAIGIPSPLRDKIELAIVHLAVETDWPLFGICRGIQVLNVALGGSLYTDVPSQFPTGIRHDTLPEKGRQFLAHEIDIVPHSSLAKIMGSTRLAVNSFHHQAIKSLAPNLAVTARSTDDLIEAVELPGHAKPIFGVQWHPENLLTISYQKALFLEFIQACS